MAADPVGFCKLKFVYADTGGLISPGIELKITGAPTDDDLQTAVGVFGGFWNDRLSALTPPNWELDLVRLIYSDGAIDKLFESTVAALGTLGSTVDVPRSACTVTGWQIASFYRGGKPRTYFPGLARFEGASNVSWQHALVSDFNDAAGLLVLGDIASYAAGGITAVIPGCIRRHRLHAPIVPPEFFPYLGKHTDNRVCSQRKRLGPLS